MNTLRFERSGAVGWLRLHRPERLNAQTVEMWRELADLGRELRQDRDLRCLVVIGEGRAFSSGIDLEELRSQASEGLFAPGPAAGDRAAGEDPVVASIRRVQEAFTWIAAAPFPSIAAVRGFALGAGLQLALACDLRIVARGTVLGLLEHRLGLLPDLGGTWFLPRVVGPARAKELIFTARHVDAEEALRLGLAERLVEDAELEEAATALAGSIAAQPPIAVRLTKRALDDAAFQTVDQALRQAAVGQAECLRSADFAEAVRAAAEKRQPRYENR